MLKRLWIALSLIWDSFWGLLVAFGQPESLLNPGLWFWLSLPWVIGIAIWLVWRFVRGARSTAMNRY